MYTNRCGNVFVGAEFFDTSGQLIMGVGARDIANDNMTSFTLEQGETLIGLRS